MGNQDTEWVGITSYENLRGRNVPMGALRG